MSRPRLKLSERRVEEHRCACCTDEVSRDDARSCPGCGIRMHSECVMELGSLCPSVGCGETAQSFRGRRPRGSVVTPRSGEGGGLGFLLAPLAAPGMIFGLLCAHTTGAHTPLRYLGGAVFGGLSFIGLFAIWIGWAVVGKLAQRHRAWAWGGGS